MKELEVMKVELHALRLALEYIATPLIAEHPHRDDLLDHLSQYRRQVVGSRDPAKASLAEILGRLDQAVRQHDQIGH